MMKKCEKFEACHVLDPVQYWNVYWRPDTMYLLNTSYPCLPEPIGEHSWYYYLFAQLPLIHDSNHYGCWGSTLYTHVITCVCLCSLPAAWTTAKADSVCSQGKALPQAKISQGSFTSCGKLEVFQNMEHYFNVIEAEDGKGLPIKTLSQLENILVWPTATSCSSAQSMQLHVV